MSVFSQEKAGEEASKGKKLDPKTYTVPKERLSLDIYQDFFNTRIAEWTSADFPARKDAPNYEEIINQEEKLFEKIQKDLSQDERNRLYAIIGKYYFTGERKMAIIGGDIYESALKKRDIEIEKVLEKNKDYIQAIYTMYLVNIFTSSDELLVGNLNLISSKSIKIFMLLEAMEFSKSKNKVVLLNLYHAYVIYSYRSRGMSRGIRTLEDMKDKNFIKTMNRYVPEFDNIVTMSGQRGILSEDADIWFACSDIGISSIAFPKKIYTSKSEINDAVKLYFTSPLFFRGSSGDYKISRGVYAYFENNFDKMYNYIIKYNQVITLDDIKRERYLPLSSAIKFIPGDEKEESTESTENETKSEEETTKEKETQ